MRENENAPLFLSTSLVAGGGTGIAGQTRPVWPGIAPWGITRIPLCILLSSNPSKRETPHPSRGNFAVWSFASSDSCIPTRPDPTWPERSTNRGLHRRRLFLGGRMMTRKRKHDDRNHVSARRSTLPNVCGFPAHALRIRRTGNWIESSELLVLLDYPKVFSHKILAGNDKKNTLYSYKFR